MNFVLYIGHFVGDIVRIVTSGSYDRPRMWHAWGIQGMNAEFRRGNLSKTVRRSKRISKDNVMMDQRETGCEDGRCMKLA
jgi:hypothetical protein